MAAPAMMQNMGKDSREDDASARFDVARDMKPRHSFKGLLLQCAASSATAVLPTWRQRGGHATAEASAAFLSNPQRGQGSQTGAVRNVGNELKLQYRDVVEIDGVVLFLSRRAVGTERKLLPHDGPEDAGGAV